MKLAIGNDHAAVEMKKEIKAYLEGRGIEVIDVGTDSPQRFNYPLSGYRAAKLVASGRGKGVESTLDLMTPQGYAATAEAARENRGSCALLEKCGFTLKREASFRKYHMDIEFDSCIYERTLL